MTIQKLVYPTNMNERFGGNRLCILIYRNQISGTIGDATQKVTDVFGNVVQGNIPRSFAQERSKSISQKEAEIFLPTPLSISTNYSVSYSDVSITDIGMSLISKAASGLAESASTLLSNKNPLASSVLKGLPSFLGSIPTKEIGQLQSSITGLAVNPHQELLLNGVKFREFKIAYNLIAKNKDDSNVIKDIIKVLKTTMHPELLPNNLLFKYPSEYELLFYKRGNDTLNEYLFKTKRCILKDLQVSYGKNFTTFKETNAPVEVEFTMTFQETEILTREEIEKQTGQTY